MRLKSLLNSETQNQLRQSRVYGGIIAAVIATATAVFVIESTYSPNHLNQIAMNVTASYWSKPVDWVFESQAVNATVSLDVESQRYKISVVGLSDSATRSKDAGRTVLVDPIQTHVLVATLQEQVPDSVSVKVSGIDEESQPIFVNVRGATLMTSDGRLTLDGLGINESSGQGNLVDRVIINPTITIYVAVDRCAIRESRQICPLADFSNTNLIDVDFVQANLRGSDFSGATMTRAKLDGADLSGAIFREVDLTGASLVGVDMSEAFMVNVDFTDAKWTR